jgi:hypothetical protein
MLVRCRQWFGTSRSARPFPLFADRAMQLVQILLPGADNAGTPFDRKAYDAVKEELARRFDGVTAYLQAPAEGLWHQGAKSRKDQIVIFEVMVKTVDLAGLEGPPPAPRKAFPAGQGGYSVYADGSGVVDRLRRAFRADAATKRRRSSHRGRPLENC